MASRPLGSIDVEVDGNIDRLIRRFKEAEAASDAFYKRVSKKLASIPVGGAGGAGGGTAGAASKSAAEGFGRALERVNRAGNVYHQTIIQIANDNRRFVQVTDNSNRSINTLTNNVQNTNNRFTTLTRTINNTSNETRRYTTNNYAAERSLGAVGRAAGTAATSLDGVRRTLLASASVIAGAIGINALKEATDSYTRYTNQLKVAGLEGGQLMEVQNALYGSAQKYGVQLEALGSLHGRLTQSQKELGATNQQMIQFTNGVAAAVKVQGASTEQASGALLQLSQAMGSQIVRAEEFNSINEGARPILQAVANGIDRFGGSVSKLRSEVIEGKVTSQEFFQGFLRGSAELEQQATKATLTIGASLQILNNAFGKYVGETDKSLSATARIGAAIKALADNLDVIMPILTSIILAIGTRYVVAMGAATIATLKNAAANAAAAVAANTLSATMVRMAGMQGMMAAGSAAAAAAASVTKLQIAFALAGTAGRGLVALLGGPFGIAILAAAGATYLYYQRVQQAEAEVKVLEQHTADLSARLRETSQYGASAASGIAQAGGSADNAAGAMLRFAGATGEAARQLRDLARERARTAIAGLILDETKGRQDMAAADRRIQEAGPTTNASVRFGSNAMTSVQREQQQKARWEKIEAEGNVARAYAERQRLTKLLSSGGLDAFVRPEVNARKNGGRDLAGEISSLQSDLVAANRAGNTTAQREILQQIKLRQRITALIKTGLSYETASATAEAERLKAGKSGAGAARAAEAARVRGVRNEEAFETDSNRLDDEILKAKQTLSGAAEDQAQIARDRIAADSAQEINRIKADLDAKKYTDAQAKVLLEKNDELRKLQLQAVDLEKKREAEKKAREASDRIHEDKIDQLRFEQDIAKTASQRRQKERDILEAQKAYERMVLQATIDSPYSTQEEKDRAKGDLGTLEGRYSRKSRKIDHDAVEEMYGRAPSGTLSGIRSEQRQTFMDRDNDLATIDEAGAILQHEAETQEERERILRESAQRRVDIETEAAKKIMDLEIARKTLQLSNAEEMAAGLATIAEGIAGKQSGIYKAMFATEKAFAIARASIALYENIAQAMKIGFPQNLPFIAGAIAQGAMIVQNIQSVSAGFQRGGWTGNGAANSERGTVHAEEFVVRKGPAASNRDLLEDINAGRDPTARFVAAAAAMAGQGGMMGRSDTNITIENNAPGVVVREAEGLGESDVRRLIVELSPQAVASDMNKANSKTRKSIERNTTARTRKR